MVLRLIYPVPAELGARLSSTFVYNVLKHSLKYLFNSLKQSLRAYKRAQVREIHVDNWGNDLEAENHSYFKPCIFPMPPSCIYFRQMLKIKGLHVSPYLTHASLSSFLCD